jgi:TP901 family phage tail tape measure protein
MANETIVTNIVANANFSSLIANVQRATAELAQLKGALSTTNKALAMDAAKIQQGFASTLRSTGQFSTHFVSLASDVDKFGKNLDQGKLKLKDYYRTFQDHTRSSGGLIRDLARQQVQLQNAILQPLGRNAEGLMQFNVQIPRGLDLTKNKTALLKQEMQIFNKVIQDGGVQLINWGKNTQWAGRQLTVGLTVPIAAFGLAASKAFREADEQLVRLTKVYGGVAQTSAAELSKVRKEVSSTARELASAYGASYKETIALAADIAATGKQGEDLLKSTRETTRLSILGEVDRQEAMKATLAIQTAFKQNTTELSESINFLNAVENQTSTSLADLVEAIPKAGPVIQSLGGSVQDLALYLTAMKEGGVNASEGANAIKSSLASLINPTKVAKEMFQGFGINLENIVNSNAGNLTGMMVEIQSALDKLDPLSKSRAIEQLFGKFQFARMSALFENLGKEGSQTLQVLDLMKTSTQDLASIADRELTAITQSASGRYKRALESLKASLAGVGEQFLNIGTFFIGVIDKVVQFANKLPDPIKKLLTFAAGFTALTGPIIMLTGVLANFLGYIVKGAAHFRALFKGAEGWRLLTPEILAAQKAGNLLETTFYSDAKAASILSTALHNLNEEFARLKLNASSGVSAAPTISTVGGQVLMTGTAQREVDPSSKYVSAKDTRAYSHPNPVSKMSQAEKDAQTIFGIVPGADKVNQKISNNPQMYMGSDLPKVSGVSAIKGVSTGIVAGEAAKWHAMTGALAMQSKAEIELLKREVSATGLITTSLSDSYQALLPQMSRITTLAASESAEIVAQLQASKINVDQARARVIALNQQIEAMMGQAATQVATAQGRTVNLTQLPIVNQPAFDPVSGKANMKELTRPGRTRDLINNIAKVLGVKTYGASYSIETTRPKRFDKGGDIEGFGPNKTIVSGPSSIKYDDRLGNIPLNGYVLNQGASLDPKNKALVDMAPTTFGNSGPSMKALLTPKETVFGPGIHKNPELYAAVNAANNGYSFGGNIMRQKNNYGAAAPQSRTVEENDLFSIAKRLNVSDYDEDFRIRTVLHDAAILSQYMSPDEAIDMADEYLREARRRAYDPSMQDINPDLWKEIRQEQILRADELIKARTGKSILAPKNSTFTRTGVGRKFNTSAVVPTAQLIMAMRARGGDFSQSMLNEVIGEISRVIDIDPKTGKSRTGRVAFITGHPNPINEFDIHAKGNLFTGIAESEAHNSATNRQRVRSRGAIEDRLPLSAKAAAQRDLMLGKYYGMPGLLSAIARRKNMGGDIAGGDVSYNRNSYGISSLPSSALARLTAKWKPKKQFYPQGMQYVVGNQDPLHGPLQIGRSMVPKKYHDDPEYTREVLYKEDKFARQAVLPQFPIGTLEDRGKYILRQYMAGNYGILQSPGALEAVKTLSRKFSGKLYRGIYLKNNKTNPLPLDILDLISQAKLTGDYSPLIGKEFIMRRSSWSKDSGIASLFAPGHAAPGDEKAILLEAIVKNRNVVPASEVFPDARFSAPFGQKVSGHNSRSEQESIFGGKFRIVNAGNGKIQLETVVDGARANGGPVNANRPYLVGENGPELFVPKNAGGIIPGGDIVKNRTGYGALGFDRGLPSAGSQMSTSSSPQDLSPGMNPYGMKAQVLGMAGSVGGSMIGSSVAGMPGMMVGGILGQFLPMLPLAIKGALTLQKIIKLTGYGALIASALALGKYLLDLKKKAEDVGKANRLAFGGSENTLGEAGLAGKYKTLATRLKDINDQLDLQRAKASASYDANTKTGVRGLTLTIKELREETARVKKDMPETLAAFNNIDSSKVNQLATSLKAQYVAMGMSVEKATNSIYSLIAASNKSGQAVAAISSASFKEIIDRSTAAAASVKLVSTALAQMGKNTSKGFIEEINTGIEQMINSLSAYQDSLVGTKGGTDGKTELTEADALKQTLDEIGKIKGASNELNDEAVEKLKEQNIIYAILLKNGESLQSIYAKTAIYAAGLAEKLNIAAMSGKQAVEFARNLAVYQDTLNDITSSTENDNPLSALAKLYNSAKKAAEAATKASEASANFDAKYYNNKIKAIQDVIRGLEKERDLKLKMLDIQQQEADFNKSLRDEQIKYQEALAMGDMASAAQAQLSIKKIQEDRQRELTRTSISDTYQKQIDAKNKEIEDLQKKADLLSDGVASSAKNAATKTANLAAIQDYRNRINDVVTRNPDGKIGGSDQKILMAIFEEMKSAGGEIAKAAEEMLAPYKGTSGLPELVDGKPRVSMSPAVKLAKDLADKTANKEGVFETAVDKFIAAVNVFAGVTGMPYSPPGDTSKPLKLGPIPTGLKANYMRFSSGDGKKKIQVAVTTTDSESAYADYISNGWKFIEYSTTKNKSTEYSYSKLNPFNKVPKAAMGGRIKKYDFGGNVIGPGTSTSDSIPAMLSDGEYVIKASSVDKAQKEFGSDFFDTINAGRFAKGGKVSKAGTADSMIKTAESMLGYQERKGNDTIFGKFAQKAYDLQSRYIAWCGAFINWAAKKSGVDLASMVWTPGGAQSFMKSGKWTTMNPVRGDLAFMNFPGDGVNRISHVGLVRNVLSKNAVSTIEGNTSGFGSQRSGGGVLEKVRQYNLKNAPIVGFGRPSYRPVNTIKYGYGTQEYYSADDAKSDYENERYTVSKGDTLSAIAAKYGITVKQLMAMNPQLNDPKYMGGSRIFAGTKINVKKFAEGGKVVNTLSNSGKWIKPKSPYNSKNKPTGSPYGRYWGELERLYQQSPMGFGTNGKPIFNNDGKDPWGGTEIPGLAFNGKVANFSDYFHQLAEQPKKSSGPFMGLDKSPDRYAGSGASMGGIGSGAYGLLNSLFMAEGGLAKKQNWFQRYVSGFNSKDTPAAGMFGTAQLLRLIAGQSKGGDALGAAMLPLNFMGAGLGSKLGMPLKGLAGVAQASHINPVKASTQIMRNLNGSMLESAISQGRKVPTIVPDNWWANEANPTPYLEQFKDMFRGTTEMHPLLMASDYGAGFRKYWGRAYDSLVKSKDPSLKGIKSVDEFFRSIADKTPGWGTRYSEDATDPLVEAANKAVMVAHGLSADQPIALFKAAKYAGQAGYSSISSKFARAYLKNPHLGIFRDAAEGTERGLYKIITEAKKLKDPLALGGIYDEFANIIPQSLNNAVKIGSGTPRNASSYFGRPITLTDFYSALYLGKKGQGTITNSTSELEKILSKMDPAELASKMKLPKFAEGGMATPKYNVPSSSLSIGNNQNMGYNKGGSIHHYNAGGIVVNGAQGQDVKELASHIVTIMDARGSRRNSMNGGGITV